MTEEVGTFTDVEWSQNKTSRLVSNLSNPQDDCDRFCDFAERKLSSNTKRSLGSLLRSRSNMEYKPYIGSINARKRIVQYQWKLWKGRLFKWMEIRSFFKSLLKVKGSVSGKPRLSWIWWAQTLGRLRNKTSGSLRYTCFTVLKSGLKIWS